MDDSGPSPVWLITGCSSGLGRALAERVLARGQRVVATARLPEKITDLAATYPERCLALQLDVTKPEQIATAINRTVATFGQLDVVVNNAGYGLVGALEGLSDDQVRRNFETNFFGALQVIRAALPTMRTQRRGHLVAISAAAVIGNYPGFSIYGATKWALEGAMESLAAEVRPFGIKVTIVRPGPFRTAFVGRSLEQASARWEEYEGTSGKFQRFLEKMEGTQPGDPERAADAIIAAVEAERPPLRLALGAYATDKTRRQLASATRELEAWSAIGLATDFSSEPSEP
jgi:NAD(P)-dependent dehydrogenase (short-subunit alcohol dehydrogenase family)